MKIAIGSDHAGYEVKEKIKLLLIRFGYDVIDYGTNSIESVDYPPFAEKVALSVSKREADFGILICGTGIGMSITANKIPKIRAAVCYDEVSTKMSRAHNNANIFCVGSRTLKYSSIKKFLLIWLRTPFEDGRHKRRIAEITKIEKRNHS